MLTEQQLNSDHIEYAWISETFGIKYESVIEVHGNLQRRLAHVTNLAMISYLYGAIDQRSHDMQAEK